MFNRISTVLHPKTEEGFLEWSLQTNKSFYNFFCAVAMLIFLFFSTNDIRSTGNIDITLVHVSRACSIVIIAYGLWAIKYQATKTVYNSIFISILLLTISVISAWWSVAVATGNIPSDACALYVVGISVMPLVSVRGKIIITIIYLTIIGIIGYFFDVDVVWSLLYSFLTAVLIIPVQIKIESLLRLQYETILAEQDAANKDQLTNIYNRRTLEPFLQEQMDSMNERETLFIAILDIDYFKLYNDFYGHLEGDDILRKIAKTLTEQDYDRVFRFGGEEFIVTKKVVGEIPTSIDMLCKDIENLEIEHKKSKVSKYITVSLGIFELSYNKSKEYTPHLLVKYADEELYKAKDMGRNRYFIFNS